MAEVVTGQIIDFNGKEYIWRCGNDRCMASSNTPVAIKGMQRVKVVCAKCKSINQVSRFK